jgi:hypothetical protein
MALESSASAAARASYDAHHARPLANAPPLHRRAARAADSNDPQRAPRRSSLQRAARTIFRIECDRRQPRASATTEKQQSAPAKTK